MMEGNSQTNVLSCSHVMIISYLVYMAAEADVDRSTKTTEDVICVY